MIHRAGLLTAVLCLATAWPAAAPAQHNAAVRTSADAIFSAAYNLNYDEAMRLARNLVAAYPEESAAHRALAYIAGFGGGKERGIEMIQHATTVPLTGTDARLALVLVYSREGRQSDALDLLTGLMKDYPQNRLMQLEAASAAWRAGRADLSEQLLTSGLARHDADPRPKGPGERALWIYKRGIARVSLNHLDRAVSDLRLALLQGPAGWVRGRVHLELGKVADLRGQRAAALAEYAQARTLCSTHRDPWCIEQAGNFRKRPFRFQD